MTKKELIEAIAMGADISLESAQKELDDYIKSTIKNIVGKDKSTWQKTFPITVKGTMEWVKIQHSKGMSVKSLPIGLGVRSGLPQQIIISAKKIPAKRKGKGTDDTGPGKSTQTKI